MSTPPVIQPLSANARARRTIAGVPARTVWLAADASAIAACALVLLRAL